jgi:site-specific DNA-methyltransferase (adenine-specific)
MTLHAGDCRDVVAQVVEPRSVDLCYLDPPFFSGRDHGAFDDRWQWGDSAQADRAHAERAADPAFAPRLAGLLDAADHPPLAAYLCFLAARLAQVRLALADHGALFVHVDPTAGAHVRLLLDALFGRDAFVNEIVWRYRRWPIRQRAFQRMHDTLLFYAPHPEHADRRFETLFEPRAPSTRKRWGDRKIQASHRADGSRRPSENLESESDGAPLSDVWDLSIIAPSAQERTGYPTQKPLKLLRRVITAASAAGDLVLDPFCGSGTTLVAARELGRRGVGIDLSEEALEIARERLK